jgi:predicted transcriptional regulator
MLPLSKTESKVINLYFIQENKPQYYGEVARSLSIPERTAYEALKTLTEKGIIEEITDTRPQEYRLTKHWYDVAKAAKAIPADTDDAKLSNDTSYEEIDASVLQFITHYEDILPIAQRAFQSTTWKALAKLLPKLKAEIDGTENNK